MNEELIVKYCIILNSVTNKLFISYKFSIYEAVKEWHRNNKLKLRIMYVAVNITPNR